MVKIAEKDDTSMEAVNDATDDQDLVTKAIRPQGRLVSLYLDFVKLLECFLV